jgi:hypothetical protein
MADEVRMREILVLGDSHTPIFNHPSFKAHFPEFCFNVVTVIGATASGLENPNTKTQAYPIFKEALEQSSAEKVIVMLGEVDTGFVIWYRANKYQESVSAMADRAIASYSRFLLEVAVRYEVVCISTPLPTIQDGNDWGEVANARREVTATQAERTALTLEFNRQMQIFCEQQNIRYIMLDDASLGEDGVVRRELLNRDPNDHHYNPDTYSRMLIGRLTGVI